MAEQGRLNIVLAVLAVAILVGSGVTYAYTSIPKAPVETITINGTDYSWDAIFTDFAVVSFQANGENYEGVRISDILNETGLADPESHQYRVISGEDGYTKTVGWADVSNGFLTIEGKRTIFSGMKTSFWVRQVAEIEVV